MGWFRSFPGGLVSTAGLDHTLIGGEDGFENFKQPHLFPTETYGMMGRVWTLPARLTGYGERWDGDECTLWAEGEVHQVAVFKENLTLRRRIEARVGESSFRIHDEVENTGFHRDQPHAPLPLQRRLPDRRRGLRAAGPGRGRARPIPLPAGQLPLPRRARSPSTPSAASSTTSITEPDGTVPVGILNRRIGMGVYQLFNKGQLPHQTTWRMPGESLYVVAIEASTNRDAGRWDAKERGELIELDPGERRTYDLEMGALVGESRDGRLCAACQESGSDSGPLDDRKEYSIVEKRFAGKVALVTGATRGMGRATAVRLASEGALVGVNYRPTGDPSTTLGLIKEAGGEGFAVMADMRNPAQVIEMVQEVARRGGRFDYLVSNAAINPFMPWDETTVEDWDALSRDEPARDLGGHHRGRQADAQGGPPRGDRVHQLHLGPRRRALAERLLRHQGRHLDVGQGPRRRRRAYTGSGSTPSSPAGSRPTWPRP